MPDSLANGDWGRDDGIKCHACGGSTYLTNDQGGGLCTYNCDNCDEVTQVEFDDCDDDDYEPEGWEIALWEEQTGGTNGGLCPP